MADGERTGEERLSARVIELEAELLAKTKTIDVLMTRVEGSLASRSSSFAIFEQNITLEAVVAARTRELREQGEVLTRALDELRRMQVQLVQAQKLEAIGSLAAGVAHEINTPVQYVSDNVTFLSRAFVQIVAVAKAAGVLLGAAEPELPRLELERALKKAKLDFLLTQVPRALEQSRDGLTRIATIVGAMKEFSHPSSQEKELVDLAHVITTAVTVARNEWRYVAELETRFDPAMPPVPLLRNDIGQVILNLVVNAAHAIGELPRDDEQKGGITITTRREGDRAVIEVSDTGAGIPEAIRGRIFDPFFTTKAVGKGTGQGLAIVYNVVVDKHGGTIEVRSVVGGGSTFVIELPLDSARQAQAAKTAAA